MDVALLGLGIMGQGMAAQILAHGHTLRVYNRTRERAAELEAQGAHAAATPRLAAAAADVVVTMVSDDAALHAVAEGDAGFLAGLQPGALVLQTSTVAPETTFWLDGEVTGRGGAMLDAPVLGSGPEAREGRLWVLAGGDAAVIERARPVLDAVSQAVYHLGPLGHATRIKLCSNFVVAGVIAALAEGIALAEASGVDPQLYIQIVQETNMGTRMMVGKGTQMINRDFAPRFSLDNMAKDVGLALAMAAACGLRLPQGETTLATLHRGATAAGGDRDVAALFAAAAPAGH